MTFPTSLRKHISCRLPIHATYLILYLGTPHRKACEIDSRFVFFSPHVSSPSLPYHPANDLVIPNSTRTLVSYEGHSLRRSCLSLNSPHLTLLPPTLPPSNAPKRKMSPPSLPWPPTTSTSATYSLQCHCASITFTIKLSPPLLESELPQSERGEGQEVYTAIECDCTHCEAKGIVACHPKREDLEWEAGGEVCLF